MSNVQDVIDRLSSNKVSVEEIKRYLDSGNILIKSNAILAVVRLEVSENEVIDQLTRIGKSISNESRVLGLWNSGHLAIVALRLLNTKISLDKYKEVLSYLSESQKDDVDRLLNEWPSQN